ncbi:folate-binding protein YgfZ [uncultured Mobiluncus sp.]|uniref:CAF17-like 4Fe-4S cluster assembly/insertion protein YgfZ n=1 Tax=uncultured Mobiluncus sp. TaxID=293425 RepID=UPI00261AE6AD|nr:folate-binding protein [uncultured Mobiluncus sp.]
MQVTYPSIDRIWPGAAIDAGWNHGPELLEGRGYAKIPLGVLKVSGPDRWAWLNSVSTQDFSNWEPAAPREALILDPTGHIELSFFAVDDGSSVWILTEEPGGAAEFFRSMRFRSRVEIADVSADFTVVGYLQTGDEDSLAARFWSEHSQVTWADPWPGPVGNTTVFTAASVSHPADDPAAPHRELAVVSRLDLPALEATAAASGLVKADFGAWEAVRISLWRPRLGREGKPGTLPHELDWLRVAVSLQKGCYPGQETVAKLTNRGRPPRRLTFLDLDGSREELPAIGSSLTLESDGSEVGVLTSVAYHPTDGQIGLGLVKRQVDPAEMLLVEGLRAAPSVIVDPRGENPRRLDDSQLGGLLGLKARKQ